MDVNKEVDRLEKAVKRGDEDSAVEIDTNLAVYESVIKDGLFRMPKEHSETMGFYFQDWLMNLFDELIFIAMIVFSFQIENQFLAILLGGSGSVFLIGTFFSRRQYVRFLSNDIWRMRKEKMLANDFKLQLNYIQKSRAEHIDFLERVRVKRIGNGTNDFISQLFQKYPENKQENINENESQKDIEPPKQE